MYPIRMVLATAFVLVIHSSTAHSQMIVAHRGASHDAPENTLAAFELAWKQGSDGIEGDFFLTSDGQIVCIHDPDSERTGGKKLIVEQSTLAQLRQLEYGAWKHPKWRGETIPILAQVVATAPPGKTVVIELKSKVAIAQPLAVALKRLNRNDVQFMVIAFDPETAGRCKELLPESKVHWVTRFKDGHPTAAEIAATVQRLGVDGVGMKADRSIIDQAFVEGLRNGGCQEFHVWTVDSIDDAKYFQSLGAMGITTNLPGIIGPAIR